MAPRLRGQGLLCVYVILSASHGAEHSVPMILGVSAVWREREREKESFTSFQASSGLLRCVDKPF